MHKQFELAVVAALSLTLGAQANNQGPEWIEGQQDEQDAGSLALSAQVTRGTGVLARISGNLNTGSPLGGDFEDMYLIFIDDPSGFSATTGGDGGATFDTMLWLFEASDPLGETPEAFGLLANDDEVSGKTFSTLLPSSNDGSGAFVGKPGFYYIAITEFFNVPLSDGGEIFLFETADEISGPDGPGAGLPHVGWEFFGTQGPTPGDYGVDLTGVTFAIPAPGAGLVVLLTLLGNRRRES